MKQSDLVTFELLSARKGYRIGLITLDRDAALNALNFEMVKSIRQRLRRWQQSPKIAAVVVQGSGRCFSCGGDIRDLYQSITGQTDSGVAGADDYFEQEYRSNTELHKFGKPLITLGHGLIMGGGLGLFLTGSHRVVCTSAKLAWPEVKIGLFPDVLGAWYLARMEQPLGHWLAITGSPLNATDAIPQGLADYCVGQSQWPELLQQLRQQDWSEHLPANHLKVRQLLRAAQLPESEMPVSDWQSSRTEIRALMEEFDEHLSLPCQAGIGWIQQGLDSFHQGCPATVRLAEKQLALGANMTIYEVTRMDLDMAWQACRHPDLIEGIRAMVIDKDRQPVWQHANPASVPQHWLDQLMASPWRADHHPLADLEKG
ncbi:enoyl-CoA hydratase/isomerase family protein [Oceanobacter mangrovi]|uniref:enoyl-CoA hydratase/isomerase family protein n=1 Tax=Oceanobacter mangrovi TaxID=2862510 RepID=UPI001C8E0E35|nr:enoyl-CoA hydratase/isomerase family protein [Oceanobacter mangrovi]